MPRRRPSWVRSAWVIGAELERRSLMASMSADGLAAIRRLDESGRFAETVADAFQSWARMVNSEESRLWDVDPGCRDQTCCPDPALTRAVLDAATTALPRRDRPRFRAVVAGLDERAAVLRGSALSKLVPAASVPGPRDGSADGAGTSVSVGLSPRASDRQPSPLS